jgi:hypothetical protein
MPMIRNLAGSVLVGLGFVITLAAQNEEPPAKKLKSVDAKKAIADFEKAQKQAQEACDKDLAAARKQLLADLEAAQGKAAKANNLDEALLIRDVRKSYEEGALPPRKGGGLPVLEGKWQMVKADGVLGTYEFRANGTVLWSQKARQAVGRVTARGGTFLVIYPDDRTERLTPSGPRLIVEHWYPSSNYPAGFPAFAYAERVK